MGGSTKAAEVQKFRNIVLPRLNYSRHGSVSSRHSVESVEGEGLEPCTICLEDYKEGDNVCWSHNRQCNHVFHQECIVEWLLRHDGCPVCRQDYLALEDLDHEGTQAEQPEYVERSFPENIPTDEVPPSTEETEDRSADEVPRVSWIRSIFRRQRIVEPRHQDELEQPEVHLPHFQRWLPSNHEESLVAFQDSESGREGEGDLSERNESHAAHPNVIDVVIVS
jgi:hypothetical protein